MIKLVFIAIALFFSYMIFSSKESYKKLLWVIIGFIILHADIIVIEAPLQMPISRWLIFTLLFSELYNYKQFISEIKRFPLKNTLFLLILGSFCISIFDQRFELFYKIYNPFCEITDTYFIVFLGYYAIKNKSDIYKLAKPIIILLIIVSILGILNWVTKQNPYHELVINTYLKHDSENYKSMIRSIEGEADRYRASSTFNMTFNYGYVSSLLALFSFAIYNSGIHKLKLLAFIGTLAGLIGTVLCFSRTVLSSTIIAIVVIIIFSKSYSKKIIISAIIIILGITIYNTLPVFKKSIDSNLDIITTGGSKTEGSSVEMRQLQLKGAYKYFLKSPIIGNGYKYIDTELGWGDQDNKQLDSDMYGYESIIFQLMIEQGIVGLFTKFLLILSLLIFFLQKFNTNKNLAGLGLAVVTFFLFFSIGTGPLGSWPISMLFLGIIMKSIVLYTHNLSNGNKYEILNRNTRIQSNFS
jgi:hypothetical protein